MRTRRPRVKPSLDWWAPEWREDRDRDPDAGWAESSPDEATSTPETSPESWDERETEFLATLEAEFIQTRSKERVRDLAEVFTHQREVDAILDQVDDAFSELDVKFLEPACGSGNFLVEILRRKLRLVSRSACTSIDHYEHRLLRAAAAIYGIDISEENVTEARARMAHVLLDHYQSDANTSVPTQGFLSAAIAVLDANIIVGDTLNSPDTIELCDWRPRPAGRFERVWSYALIPPGERDLFWAERQQDPEPVHFSEVAAPPARKRRRYVRRSTGGRG